jgi:hypothetical protein
MRRIRSLLDEIEFEPLEVARFIEGDELVRFRYASLPLVVAAIVVEQFGEAPLAAGLGILVMVQDQ